MDQITDTQKIGHSQMKARWQSSLPKAMNGSQCLTTLTSIHKEISSNGSFAK